MNEVISPQNKVPHISTNFNKMLLTISGATSLILGSCSNLYLEAGRKGIWVIPSEEKIPKWQRFNLIGPLEEIERRIERHKFREQRDAIRQNGDYYNIFSLSQKAREKKDFSLRARRIFSESESPKMGVRVGWEFGGMNEIHKAPTAAFKSAWRKIAGNE